MRISVNGQHVDVRSANLSEALSELGYMDDCVATAVNERFVPSADRAEVTLKNGDRVEVLAPMQGG